MDQRVLRLHRRDQPGAQPRTDRIGQADVRDQAGAKKAAVARGGPIDKLIHRHQLTRRHRRVQRTDG